MQQAIDLTIFEDEIVLHFGSDHHRVRAETFATTIIELTAALKEINKVVNPDYDLEVYIDAFGPGSFRARVKALQKKTSSLLKTTATSVVLGILASFIYDKFIADGSEIKIIVNNDHYVVEHGDERVILPKEAMEFKDKAAPSKEVEKRVSKAFRNLEKDKTVKDFGITEKLEDEFPIFVIPSRDFPRMMEIREEVIPEEQRRVLEKSAHLQIVRVIFEPGKRKWEFVWDNGVKISAPILDEKFHNRLQRRDYVLGVGDRLFCMLRIHQIRDANSQVWINDHYEIVKVFDHEIGESQTKLL